MRMLSQNTKRLQALLPQWMKMAKDSDSIGAQFLDTFGLEFDDVQEYLEQTIQNQFIGTANLGQVDVMYRVPITLPVVADMRPFREIFGYSNNIAYPIVMYDSLRDFYIEDAYEHCAMIDREEGYLYIRAAKYLMDENLHKPYDYILIDGTMHETILLHHVWNTFDEFAFLLGLSRLYGERNAELKERILDVFRKPGNSSKTGLENAISRGLGIQPEDVTVNEFHQKAFQGTLFDEHGRPTQKMREYVHTMNNLLGATWDNMAWDEAYWRSLEEKRLGFQYLPHVWNPSLEGWKEDDFQSGIGDGDDLKITAPKKESNLRNFDTYIGVRGREEDSVRIDPEINFRYKITAKGLIPNEEFKPEPYRYTITSTELIKLNYIVRAYLQYYYTTAIDFKLNQSQYAFDNPNDPSLEIITGNTVLTTPTDGFLKLHADLSTTVSNKTPVVNEIEVKWKDSTDKVQSTIFTTQEDFTTNTPLIDTDLQNLYATPDGNLELGYGDFFYQIDTEGSWMEGSLIDLGIQILPEGTLTLKLPKKGDM